MTAPKTRRSSVSISLVLVSAAALTACGGGSTTAMRRDLYKTKSDCEQEWGVGSVQCEPAHDWDYGSSDGGGFSGGHYWGPAYRGARQGNEIRPGSLALSSRPVARGGFGSSSSSRSGAS